MSNNMLEGVLSITLASADKTLTTAEVEDYKYLQVTTGSATYAIIAPNIEGRFFRFVNNDKTNNATIKVSGKTGVTLTPLTEAIVYCNGTDYVEYTDTYEVLRGLQQTASHSYSSGHADWTLSVTELKSQIIKVTSANAAVNAIF